MNGPGVVPEQVDAGSKREALAELLRKRRAKGQKVRPVSFSQRRLWFLDQLSPGTTSYNIHFVAPFSAELDQEVLEQSLQAVIQRHEVLRTTFSSQDGEPMQVISPVSNVFVRKIDVLGFPPEQQELEASRITAEQMRQPFDLARGPLMRITLVRTNEANLMIMVIHHIVCDGWSMGIFGRELIMIYEALLSNKPVPLPELALQYADFAAWQRNWLQGEVLEAQLAYWRKQLNGISPLELPMDRPRPAVQSFRGAYQAVRLPEDVTSALKELGEHEGGTLFMVLLAGFQALLCRYTGQDDISVGTYIANRNRTEIEALIGFFINTLVMRTSTAGNPTFRELLSRVKDVALSAYAHQDMPFEVLVEALQPERDLSRNPLFQVVLQLFNAPTVDTASAKPEDDASAHVEKQTAIFDLAFTLWEDAGGIGGGFEYNTDIFEASTCKRIAAHFERLLQAVAEDPSLPVSELPLLAASERRQIINDWNRTQVDHGPELSILGIFWRCAQRTPQAPALIYKNQKITYGEMSARVHHLARKLSESGLRPEQFVGIFLSRSPEALIAMLAVFQSGGAYVALDPSQPAERLEFICRDANLFAVITDGELADKAAALGRPILRVDHISWEESNQSAPYALSSDRLAYAIYTSGSTGNPKGVAVEHGQILNRLRWMWREYPFGPDEIGCAKTSLTFVDSLWEMLGPLLQGIPVLIVPQEIASDPLALLRALADHGVTRIWLVPALLRELLDTIESDKTLRERLAALRFWVSSGEALPSSLAARFADLLPAAVLYNLYGTSETWDATWHDPQRDGKYPGRAPIGRPMDNIQAYILDRWNNLSPTGTFGELFIGGSGLAREYLNRPELTAEQFVPDHLSGRPGARLYRTGDLARYLPDGQIEYLGRGDRQLKLRGFRMEPAEIEMALTRHPGVRDAVVHPWIKDEETLLVAYVIPRNLEAQPTAGELVPFLEKHLPSPMVPSHFIFLDQFPLTVSGKINRLALPKPVRNPQRELTGAMPRNPLEARVLELYKDIFGLERIGIYDHFFRDLGGHSLLATRLASRIRTALDLEIPLQVLFEAPTPATLAEVIEHFELTAKSPG